MRIVAAHRTPGRSASRPVRFALVGGLALLLGGCGSKLVVVNSSVLRLRIDEYRITPDRVQVHPGRLKIVVVNTGILTHNITVEADHLNAAGQAIVVGRTGVLQPGQRLTSSKMTLTPGTYKLVDTIANHADLGDYGTMIVK